MEREDVKNFIKEGEIKLIEITERGFFPYITIEGRKLNDLFQYVKDLEKENAELKKYLDEESKKRDD